MKGKKIIIISAAAGALALGTVGIAKNSKRMRAKRMMKRVGCMMYNLGTVLRTVSSQLCES